MADSEWRTIDEILLHFDPKESWTGMFPGRPELGEFLKELVERVVTSLEGLSSEYSVQVQSVLQEDPVLWEWVVDWWYCKEAIERVIPVKERFSKLSPILVRVTQSQEVNVYLGEAMACKVLPERTLNHAGR